MKERPSPRKLIAEYAIRYYTSIVETEQQKDVGSRLARGDGVWSESMGAEKWEAFDEIRKGKLVGQYSLPGFRPYDYDILVFDPKKELLGENLSADRQDHK